MMARALLRMLAVLVPADRRAEWREEWLAELHVLSSMREEGEAGDYPGSMEFVAGAVPHAFWTRVEGWTMDSVIQDLRFASRMLRRAPGFTVVAALTLALGIGANAGIFSLVNGLMLRPPAGVEEPDRLVQIARSYDGAPRWDNWSYPAAMMIRESSSLLSEVAAYSNYSFILGRGDEVEPVTGQFVTGTYFSTLGVRPSAGRLLGPEDDVSPGAHPVAVLSHGLWQRRYGGSHGVIGTTVPVGSVPYEIVGVAPDGFSGVDALGSVPDLWVPSMQRTRSDGGSLHNQWGSSWIYVFGRLRDDVTYEAAEASMDAVTLLLRDASEVNEDVRVLMAPGVGMAPRERAEGKRIVLLLFGIAALVLILTCANVGNLFLTRATARAGEVSVRQALGASRGRLARQLVTESVLLALLAVLLAVPLLGALSGVIPAIFPFPLNVSVAPDARVYLFLLVIGVGAGVMFSALPAWGATRADVGKTLREANTTGGKRRSRIRDTLVVGQLAISLGLITGSGLLYRSVMNAQGADPGFNPDGVWVGSLNLAATGRYDEAAVQDVARSLVFALDQVPGVESAALANQAPVLGGHARATVVPTDRVDEPTAGYEAEHIPVTDGYFGVLQIPVLEGRGFRPAAEEPEPVVVVNRALADLFWPGVDALGQELTRAETSYRVVGVVADVQMRSLRAPARPAVYYALHQMPALFLTVHVKATAQNAALGTELRRAISSVDPEVPLLGIAELRGGLVRSLNETRTFGFLVAAFAGLALVLSLIGLYGLISHGVTQRGREIGIRIALGASSGELTRLILVRGAALAGGGIVLGVAVSLALGRALESLLFGVSSANPLTLGVAASLLLVAALAASWLPARRATRVDAVVTLRE